MAFWRYHRNMVGLMPTWEHLLKGGLLDGYDWVINSEPSGKQNDHLRCQKRLEIEGKRVENFFVFSMILSHVRPFCMGRRENLLEVT